MKRIALYLLLCALFLAGLCPALAAPPATDSPDWPDVPFARNIATGEIVYLGMEKAEAEAITGAPVEGGRPGLPMKNKYNYDGLVLAFRDDIVVFIAIPYEDSYWTNDEWVPSKAPRWAANGVAAPFMPTDQALEALGMTAEEGLSLYRLIYFEDGVRAQFDRKMFEEGLKDFQWEITLFGDGQIIGVIMMGDKQVLATGQ